MPTPIHPDGLSVSLAGMVSQTAYEKRAEARDTYAATYEATNTNGSCVWRPEAPPAISIPVGLILVTRLQAFDETAFHEIIDRYASRIYRAAYGIVRNHEAADEIAIEVFA
jgi:hypothetical protein